MSNYYKFSKVSILLNSIQCQVHSSTSSRNKTSWARRSAWTTGVAPASAPSWAAVSPSPCQSSWRASWGCSALPGPSRARTARASRSRTFKRNRRRCMRSQPNPFYPLSLQWACNKDLFKIHHKKESSSMIQAFSAWVGSNSSLMVQKQNWRLACASSW